MESFQLTYFGLECDSTMFNFNLELKDLFNSPIALAVFSVILSILFFIFGYLSTGGSKSEVCREEFKRLDVQSKQITTLESKLASCVASGETNCIKREQRICRTEKEDIKENCNKLLDRIYPNSSERLK